MSDINSRFAIFNNWNFNSVAGLQVYAIDPPGQGSRTLNLFDLARRSARKLSSAFYQKNTKTICVYIKANSRELLEQALDTLYANIQGQEGALVVPQSGTVRQYTATYESTTINNTQQNANSPAGNVADLTLTFELSDSYGYDTNYSVIQAATNFTASLVTTQYTQGGSADTQLPHIEVEIITTTGTQPATITVGNQNTGQAVSVSRTWQPYDLLIVGLINGLPDVQVNGVSVPFTGAIPEMGLGLQNIYYQDTFATRTVNIFAYVYNRWL
jgi:hypothetical protein